MAKVEFSTTINRPLEEVFAYVSNSANNPQWVSVFIEVVKTSPGAIGVGTTWHDVGKLLGRRLESEGVVTEYEENRVYARKVTSGPFPAQLRAVFRPTDDGTRVNFTSEAELGGFFKMAEALVERMLRRQLETDVANLKDLLETDPVPA
jgi:uncharacterized protein YndB with AHSA1/START domain